MGWEGKREPGRRRLVLVLVLVLVLRLNSGSGTTSGESQRGARCCSLKIRAQTW